MPRQASCRRAAITLGTLFLGLQGGPTLAAVLDTPIPISLPAQPLGEALRALARQANLQILFDPELVAGRSGAPISGTLLPQAALAELLRATGLEASEQAPGVVIVRHRREDPTPAGVTAIQAAGSPATSRRADAWPDTGASLEEIIVTAQRRQERLQDVPVSLIVHTRAAMDAQGARNVGDLSRLTPGVTFVRSANNNNSESSSIAIRGITSNAGASTTGIYIDDTPIQGRNLSFPSFNTYPALFDIERVEVLRGPQGTLFGAGSEGGTVRFISPEPGLERHTLYSRAEVAMTSQGDPLHEVGVAAGGPLVKGRLGFRASASYRHEGGYVDRVDWHAQRILERNANSNATLTARLALKGVWRDRLSITPSIYYQQRDSDDTSAWWQPRAGEPDPTGGQFERPFRTGNAVASPNTDRLLLSALKLEWSLGGVQFVSSTSYFDRQQSATTDYSQFNRAIFFDDPYPPVGVRASGKWGDAQRNWTQELRLESTDARARVAWTAGLFLQRAREITRHRVYDPALLVDFGLPPDAGGGFIYVEDPRIGIDRQIAVFGQADIRLSEHLKLTLGLRHARAVFKGSTYYPETLVVGPAVSSRGTLREHPLTPRIGLSLQIAAEHLLYATAAKGYRIGGVNAKVGQFCYGGADSALGQIGLTDVPPAYSSDSVWSYELGTKNSFGDHRVLLNASAYVVRWSNIQQNVPLTACGFQYTGNLGEAESRGFDVQAVIKATNAWSLGGSFAYTDARFTKTVQLQPTVQSIVRDGDHLAGAPWTLAVFSEVSLPAFGGSGYLRADHQYSARQSDRVAASNPLNGGYALWFDGVRSQSFTSLRAGVKWQRLDLSLFAQNLLDTRPRLTTTQDIATAEGGTPLFYTITWRPRTIGLSATYRY